MNLCDAIESRSTFRRTEYLGPNYFGLAAQYCDSQRYVFVLIHLLESINVFGTRIHYHQFYFCHSVLLFSVRFATIPVCFSPDRSTCGAPKSVFPFCGQGGTRPMRFPNNQKDTTPQIFLARDRSAGP